MQPKLHSVLHRGADMQRPTGFVLHKEQKQDEKRDRTTSMSKRVTGHPGHVRVRRVRRLEDTWAGLGSVP